jgi:hypothetical protein
MVENARMKDFAYELENLKTAVLNQELQRSDKKLERNLVDIASTVADL